MNDSKLRARAYEQELATPLYFCHGVFIDRFIFRSSLLWMRLPWECHNQSQDTNWRHCVTGPELPFFHRRKGVLKIDQSVKMPWHRPIMGVASSCSSAPDCVWYYSDPSHIAFQWRNQSRSVKCQSVPFLNVKVHCKRIPDTKIQICSVKIYNETKYIKKA